MYLTLKHLSTLPKATISLEGEYLEASNSEVLGLDDDLFLGQNVKQFLGTETWFDILLACYKNRIHIQESTVNLPNGKFKLKVKYELTDGLVYAQVLEITPMGDVANPETIFYNWLDNQALEGVSIVPNLENRELALLFQSLNNTKQELINCNKKAQQFISQIGVHKHKLKEVIDKFFVFKDGFRIYPLDVLSDTMPVNNLKVKGAINMLAEKEVIACREKINPWDSILVRNSPGLLNLFTGDCVSIFSAEKGYKCLGAWAGFDPRQFNRPIETMVGNDYDCIDVDLARLLHDSIQRLLVNGRDYYKYEHKWKGYTWELEKWGALMDVGNGRHELVYKTCYPEEKREMQTTRFLTLMDMEK